MGWNFRKRAKIFPGVHLNFSSKGISTTIGPRGASFNIGPRGTYFNAAIPGLGLYKRTKLSGNSGHSRGSKPLIPDINYADNKMGEIKSAEAQSLTSNSLEPFKNLIVEAYKERNDIERQVSKIKFQLFLLVVLKYFSWLFIIGFFVHWFKKKEDDKGEELQSFQRALEECKVRIEVDIGSRGNELFSKIQSCYNALVECTSSWEITHEFAVDSVAVRTVAKKNMARKKISLSEAVLAVIDSVYKPVHFPSANGENMFMYPGFLVIVDRFEKIGLIDIRDLESNYYRVQFIETEQVPSDTKVLGQTWFKANKDGSRDMRFNGNYQIPLVEYGQLNFKSSTGLNEEFLFSKASTVKDFVDSINALKQSLKSE